MNRGYKGDDLTGKGCPMLEKRRSPRRRVLKAGTIAFAGAGVPCRIRNVSETGAAIDVTSADDIPDEFKLVIEVDAFIRRCRIVWRNMSRLGVAFV
jgi:hypothetical protein